MSKVSKKRYDIGYDPMLAFIFVAFIVYLYVIYLFKQGV